MKRSPGILTKSNGYQGSNGEDHMQDVEKLIFAALQKEGGKEDYQHGASCYNSGMLRDIQEVAQCIFLSPGDDEKSS